MGGKREASSKIDYLLIGSDYSAFHRLRSKEVWRYKEGTSLTLYIIQKNSTLAQVKIGNPLKEDDAISEFLVEHDQWFAAAVNDKNSFSFVECEVIPGFDYRD
jgi:predicted cupin superfamily sugar epimerase